MFQNATFYKNIRIHYIGPINNSILQNIKADFETNTEEWKKLYDSLEPHLATFPDPWDKHLDYFQKCLVLRVIRYDKIIPAIRHFIARKFNDYLITNSITILAVNILLTLEIGSA